MYVYKLEMTCSLFNFHCSKSTPLENHFLGLFPTCSKMYPPFLCFSFTALAFLKKLSPTPSMCNPHTVYQISMSLFPEL